MIQQLANPPRYCEWCGLPLLDDEHIYCCFCIAEETQRRQEAIGEAEKKREQAQDPEGSRLAYTGENSHV